MQKDVDCVPFEPPNFDMPLAVLIRRILAAPVCGSAPDQKLPSDEQQKIVSGGLARTRTGKRDMAVQPAFRVQTAGSDLKFLLEFASQSQRQVDGLTELDWRNCVTNSIQEIAQTLGIAAAMRWIQKQLQDVLNSNGSQVPLETHVPEWRRS